MKTLKIISIIWMFIGFCGLCGCVATGESIHLFLLNLLIGISPYVILKLIIRKNGKAVGIYIVVAIILVGLISVNNKFAEINRINAEIERRQAEYEASLHTVYFDTDGGKAIEPIRVQKFDEISKVKAVKYGYEFVCWLIDGEPIEYSSEKLTQDITLTASYKSLKPTREELASAKAIDYVTLFKKGEYGKFYKITGKIVQTVKSNIYHINMTDKGIYYQDRIQIEIKEIPSEVLMNGDIISFKGKYLGKTTYITSLLTENTIPNFEVYAENLRVIGHED